jgi:hypothetical protein
MIAPAVRYPAPIVRLELMAAWATALGLPGDAALGDRTWAAVKQGAIDEGAPAAKIEAVEKDLEVISELIRAARDAGETGNLTELITRLDPAGHAEAQARVWSGRLKRDEVFVEGELPTACDIAAGSLAAWIDAVNAGDAAARANLRGATVAALRRNVPAGTRAAAIDLAGANAERRLFAFLDAEARGGDEEGPR